ncbi:MAG: cytochrome c family protein [Rhodoblastus sp.]
MKKAGYENASRRGRRRQGGYGQGGCVEPFPVPARQGRRQEGRGARQALRGLSRFHQARRRQGRPPLYGVLNRAKGHVAGFAYSDALKAKGGDWSYDENSNKFIADPKKDIPGTKMAFAGEKDDGKRADIVAYLRSLADTPRTCRSKATGRAERFREPGQPRLSAFRGAVGWPAPEKPT